MVTDRFVCNACGLSATCGGPIPPSEGSDPLLVICGDRPGVVEDQFGSHFVGPTGEILDDVLRDVDLPRHKTVMLNLTLCYPPDGRDAKTKEIESCVYTYMRGFMTKWATIPWILMGSQAIRYIGGESGGVKRNFGRRWVTKDGLVCFGAPNPAAVAHGSYRTDQIVRVFLQALDRLEAVSITKENRCVLAVDTETTGLDFYREARPFIATSCDGKTAKLYELDTPADRAELQHDMDSADEIAMANALFDCGQLDKLGIWADLNKVVDIQWAASLDDAGNCPYRLERLGDHYFKNGGAHKRVLDNFLKTYMAEHKIKSLAEGFKSIPREHLNKYALFDAGLTWGLHQHPSLVKARALNTSFIAREHRLLKTLQHIESRGMLIDLTRIQEAIEELGRLRDDTLIKLRNHPDIKREFPEFNPNSHPQTRQVMDLLEIHSPEKTKTGAPAYGKTILALLGHTVPQMILEYRSYRLLAGGALESIPRAIASDGRIHPSFHSTGTESGRFTCKTRAETEDERVNLHGIPKIKKVRAVFTAPPGFSIVSIDMSQIENRGMAHFAGARSLIDGYTNDPNTDFYSLIASRIYDRSIHKNNPEDNKIRQEVKAVVLAKGYGAGIRKISKMIRRSIEYTQEFIATYDAAIPEIQDFFIRVANEVAKTGRVKIEDWSCPVDRRVAYQGVNRIIQGSCAVHLKRLLNEIDSLIAGRDDIYMIMHVHDEIVFEISNTQLGFWIPKLKRIMESGWNWAVPVVVNVEYGKDWGFTQAWTG